MSESLRRALVSVSLSNLFFLPAWLILLNPSHYVYYYWPSDPGWVECEALVIDVLLLAVVFWLLSSFALHFRSSTLRRIGTVLFVLSLAIPFTSFFTDYLQVPLSSLIGGHRGWLLVLILFAGLLCFALYRYPNRVVHITATLLIILSPLIIVNLASVIWLRARSGLSAIEFQERTPTTRNTTRADSRQVIWIVFDEFDQAATFDARPPSLKLPAIDAFRDVAIDAHNAFPPNRFTLFSMPSLTTGRLFADALPIRANEVELTLPDNSKLKWSEQDNVFAEARREGLTAGLAGWFHSYCRVIGDDLDSCQTVPVVDAINPSLDQLSLTKAMSVWSRTALFRVPFAFRLIERGYDRLRADQHREEFERLSSAANQLLEQRLNLSLLHYPIPHQPWIFNKGNSALGYSPQNDYYANLMLVDRTIGEIRQRLERELRWDKTTVLVTSDHWWRGSELHSGRRDHRIPFMLKLAGQKSGVEFDAAFNTVLTRKLLMEVLRGTLAKPEEVVSWINENSSVGESPFTQNLP
ncbi:MAG: hypothetical protein C5B55_14235 [Blastocatellia bacterium]|nr:MAG: hypothetical protein C5B55_14235 [Blastocatellia bacterium]